MKKVCVFCGSSIGTPPIYAETARLLGRLIADRGLTLVFGGGHVGLMGVLADAVLDGGGAVIGVIPQGLADRELAHPRCTQMHVTASMHERKALMANFADAIVAMPGQSPWRNRESCIGARGSDGSSVASMLAPGTRFT